MFKHAAKTIMPALVASPVFASVPRALPRAAHLRTCAVTSQMPCVEQKVEQARSEHLVEQTMNKLKEKRHAITTVESCTGGMLANLLTNVGGAAEVYWGSVVTYDGSLKSDWGVPAGSIKEVGTVTEQVQNCIMLRILVWKLCPCLHHVKPNAILLTETQVSLKQCLQSAIFLTGGQ